uniref:Uncharacterized protein n=1 Tax=Tanacetum cinerariifolium TaxID=118510 RepID=A0A6L2N9L4_TANCI|nr:hypothetical protein [Tanacetum cinerariifolium]
MARTFRIAGCGLDETEEAFAVVTTNEPHWTIPAEFVRKHELYSYDHAILHHRGVEYKIRLDFVRNRKKPHLNSHLVMKGKWNIISRECGFAQNKMVRFKYVADVKDEDEVRQVEFPVMIPMFDIC